MNPFHKSKVFALNFMLPGLLCCALSACQAVRSLAPPAAMPAMKVRMEILRKHDIMETTRYLATLKSRKAVTLKSQVSGQIQEIAVRSGDHVQKGEVLIKLDPAKQESAVNSLVENMESIRAEKSTAEATMTSLEANKEAKAAQAEFAKNQVQRYSLLFSQGAVSKEQVDQKNTDLRTALADLHSIESQIKAQESAISKSQKQINQSKASIKEQQTQLQYFTIRAPFEGAVGDIPVRVGEYVTNETQLTTVNQNQPLEVYINVPTERSAKLKVGLRVRLLDAAKNYSGQAEIFFISPQVNNDNQSILVKAIYENPDNALRSGQLLTAEIIWKNSQELLLPTEAVSMLAGQAFVFVARPSAKGFVANQMPVDLGEISGNYYQVKSGLQDGDRIIPN
ncbi:MAG: efflux RND transporter periplasmic adaptor subunit [Candidatus Obscuribacterales bacterium]|nr:efflux RND transporter periplasmic adaptor subunit [Candidatus Obscuribacterales bacterium]